MASAEGYYLENTQQKKAAEAKGYLAQSGTRGRKSLVGSLVEQVQTDINNTAVSLPQLCTDRSGKKFFQPEEVTWLTARDSGGQRPL